MRVIVLLSLIFTATCLLLLVIELAIRILFRLRNRNSVARERWEGDGKTFLDAYDDMSEGRQMPPWMEPAIDYNTYMGFIPKAGVTNENYSTNSYHFRYDDDFPEEKEPNEIRIFVTGGSKAWGAGVTQRALYTRLIEKQLAKRYPDRLIRVICAAGNAYCSTQERIMVENVVLRLSPDYVIMFSGRNDCYFGYVGKDTMIDQDYFGYERILNRSVPEPFDRYSLKIGFVIDKVFRSANNSTKPRPRDSELVVATLLTNIHILSDLSRRYAFKLLFYLEPSIFTTKKRLSLWEESVLSRSNQRFPGLQGYTSEIYQMLKERFPEDSVSNKYVFIDGDEAISAELKSVFSDNVHYGDRGYALTTKHMLEYFERVLPVS